MRYLSFLTFWVLQLGLFKVALHAAPTNAYQRTDVANELEDVSDIINDISPEETPFMTAAGTVTVENTKYEYDTDELDAVNAANAHIDGDVFAGEAVTAPTRLASHCQISRKDFIITRRARKMKKTGQKDEVSRQVARKGRELKRDCEAGMLANNAAVADNGSAAPETGGLPSWIEGDSDGRADRGGGGSEGGYASGTSLTVAATDGTDRALDESGMLAIVTSIFKVSKLTPNILMMGPTAKSKFSQYMFGSSARIATPYQDHGKSARGGVTVVGAVDLWVSDFSTLELVPNLWQREDDAFFLNMDVIDVGYFDPMSTDAMAKTADTDDRMVLVDYCLIVRNEKALGIFADVDETLAMVA
jgi:hypothetical protein